MRKLACGVLAASLASVAPLARADDAVEPVRIEVDADFECGSDRLFFDAVRARTARVRWAEPNEAGRTFRVRIRQEEVERVGTLVILDGPKTSQPRTFRAMTCRAVVDALAFVVALSIDPAAHREAVLALPATPADPPPPPPPPPPWPVEPVGSILGLPPAPSKEEEKAATPRPEPSSNPSSTPSSKPARSAWNLAVGAGVELEAPHTPSAGIGARTFAAIGHPLGPQQGRVELFPTGRLSFDIPYSWNISGPLAPASFTWIRGQADVCPIRLKLAAPLYAAPCGGVEAGVLEASTSAPRAYPTTRHPWVAASLSAVVRWQFLRVFFAEVTPSLFVPLVREQFKLHGAPNDVYEAPPLYLGGLVALGVHFP